MSPFLHERADDEVVLTVEERIEQIVSELTVDKKNTSLNRMKYMSASDNRRSSVGIGAMAALIIFSVFGVIVLIDLSRIFHDIKHAFRGLFSVLGLHGLQSALKLQTAPNKTTRDASETASATSTALSNLSVSSLLYTETSGNMDSALSQIFEIDNSVGDNIPPVSTSLA